VTAGRLANRTVFVEPDHALAAVNLRRWVGTRLLSWFDTHQRDLPWRKDRDPYRIWVSEVMLQQTQVATVIPYFERFLGAFPTLTDLADASEDDVLLAWEGLGYYRRARDLHQAARELVYGSHQVTVPDDPKLLGRLPGLGRYTRNAVLSQAFDRRLPILEANSQRVLSRLFGREPDPREGPARRWLWAAAEALLPAKRVGAFNQALMELGAVVCTPVRPQCHACPLAQRCAARMQGRQDEIPRRNPAPAPVPVRAAAVVLRRKGRVLLARRPPAGRWAGMWEFPHAELHDAESPEEGADRVVRQLTGLTATLGPELLTIRHGVTRYRITLVCFEAGAVSGEFVSPFYRTALWLTPRQLTRYPVSAAQRRLAEFLARPVRQRLLF
jgi:A/G-specific adenine glycosylase